MIVLFVVLVGCLGWCRRGVVNVVVDEVVGCGVVDAVAFAIVVVFVDVVVIAGVVLAGLDVVMLL